MKRVLLFGIRSQSVSAIAACMPSVPCQFHSIDRAYSRRKLWQESFGSNPVNYPLIVSKLINRQAMTAQLFARELRKALGLTAFVRKRHERIQIENCKARGKTEVHSKTDIVIFLLFLLFKIYPLHKLHKRVKNACAACLAFSQGRNSNG